MLIFRKLSVAYFKTFRRKQVFAFPTSEGLYLLTGKNLVAPELTSNACGKSSLLDALSWVLFGKTARSLKSTDIAPWGGGGKPRVALSFAIEGKPYRLIRTHKPNSLTLSRNGEPPDMVTQEVIEKLIGFNHNIFLATVLMGQFGRFFFDLGATEKLAVFSEILSLQYWLDLSKRAGSLADVAEANHAKEEIRLAEIVAQLEVTRESIVEARTAADKFDADRATNLARLKKELRLAEQDTDEADRRYAESKKNIVKVSDNEDGEPERKLVDRLRCDLQTVKANRTSLTDKVETLIKEGKRLQSSAANRLCPTCGQPVKSGDGHLKAEAKRLTAEAGKVSTEGDRLIKKIKRLTIELANAEEALSDRLGAIRAKRNLRDSLARDVSEAGLAVKIATEAERNALAQYKTARETENPHTLRLISLRKRAEQLKTDKIATRESLAKHADNANGFGYWKSELKNLRLWLIKESLLQLEVEINNALIQLGLRGWTITTEIERVTQSGKVSRGFNVFIQSPTSPKRVKWESWSGGETTRLRIASAAGLSALMRSRYGINLPLEFWDECASYLSEEGVEDVLEYFKQRSTDEGLVVYLVEHTVHSSGLFSGRTRIVRTKAGSLIKGVGSTKG